MKELHIRVEQQVASGQPARPRVTTTLKEGHSFDISLAGGGGRTVISHETGGGLVIRICSSDPLSITTPTPFADEAISDAT
jgi:hypothetical protein